MVGVDFHSVILPPYHWVLEFDPRESQDDQGVPDHDAVQPDVLLVMVDG